MKTRLVPELVEGQCRQVRFRLVEDLVFTDAILVVILTIRVAVQISEFGHGVFFL